MRISFVDLYGPTSDRQKDPITIPLALRSMGHELDLVSVNGWEGELFALPVSAIEDFRKRLEKGTAPDAIVAITRFRASLTSLLQQATAVGCRVIVKGDTDGTAGYPLRPNYLRARPIASNPTNILRHLKWRLPLPAVIRPRLEQIGLSEATVVESPGAAANLSFFLTHWGHSELIPRVRFIPNPVSAEVLYTDIPTNKQPTIIAVGRWDDPVKGPDILCNTINTTLSACDSHNFLIIGFKSEEIQSKIYARYRSKVRATGVVDFQDAHQLMAESQILLSTSLVESFSFATAEALCVGTSVVVPPIESLVYLAGGGAYGTISSNFSSKALSAALLQEIAAWHNAMRKPRAIAERWRAELDPTHVGLAWEKLLKSLD